MFERGDRLFIADCHLDGSRPGVTALLLRFLADIEGAGELWIVGDLVEYWLGDDVDNPALHPVFEALKNRVNAGTSVHLMHGNRDFLLGETFAEQIGAQLHRDDECELQFGDEKALVMHGDTLCTDDTDYQQLRQTLRDKSRDATAAKSNTIMDVNAQAVQTTFQQHGISTLIHGHTHRPDTHHLSIDNLARRRLVLGDWHDDHAWVGVANAHSAVIIEL